ncbi:MAG: flagellar export chaperone FliS [Lysobacterales bacterium]
MNLQFALDSYHQAGPISEVETASRYRLIQILMEHGLMQLADAAAVSETSDAVKCRQALGKAIDAVETLRQSLSSDHENEELGQRLESLYGHMIEELVRSSGDLNKGRIAHVQRLMTTIKAGWDELPNHRGNDKRLDAYFL